MAMKSTATVFIAAALSFMTTAQLSPMRQATPLADYLGITTAMKQILLSLFPHRGTTDNARLIGEISEFLYN